MIKKINFKIIFSIIILHLIIFFELNPYFFNAVGFIIFILYNMFLFFYYPTKILENFPYMLSLIPMLIGNFLLEFNKNFIPSTEKIGYINGTFLRNLFIYLFIIFRNFIFTFKIL
jgi:hypothetical protein